MSRKSACAYWRMCVYVCVGERWEAHRCTDSYQSKRHLSQCRQGTREWESWIQLPWRCNQPSVKAFIPWVIPVSDLTCIINKYINTHTYVSAHRDTHKGVMVGKWQHVLVNKEKIYVKTIISHKSGDSDHTCFHCKKPVNQILSNFMFSGWSILNIFNLCRSEIRQLTHIFQMILRRLFFSGHLFSFYPTLDDPDPPPPDQMPACCFSLNFSFSCPIFIL